MSDNLRFKKNLLETFDPVSGIMYQLRMGSVATNTTILSSVVSSMIMGASHADGEFGFEFDVYDAEGTNDSYLNYLVRYNSSQTVKTLNIVTIKDTDTENPQIILNASKINFDTFSTGASFGGGGITDISYISSQSISTNVLSSGSAYVGSLTGSNISTINFQADKLDVRTINVINVSTFTLSTQSVIANSISTLAISSGTTILGTTTAGSMTVTGLSTIALSSGVAITGGITALGLSTTTLSSGTTRLGTTTASALSTTSVSSLTNITGNATISSITWTSRNVIIGSGSAAGTGQDNSVAIGVNTSVTNQGSHCVAIGNTAGNSNQGNYGIGIGFAAGSFNQGVAAVAIGPQSGRYSQGLRGFAMGDLAGLSTQRAGAVALGALAGQYTQGLAAVAIGCNAGNTNQGDYAVAMGLEAGSNAQAAFGVAIGYAAGSSNQGITAFAFGPQAGRYNQGAYAIAMSDLAGFSNQGCNAIAFGRFSGYVTQGCNAIAIGCNAGSNAQGIYSIAIGQRAGESTQGQYSIAVGQLAGSNAQGNFATAINFAAGEQNQGLTAIAIGPQAGRYTQRQYAIAVGEFAGSSNQSTAAVAIGRYAGFSTQGVACVAIGSNAGSNAQGAFAVSMGYLTADNNQGLSAVAIGPNAARFSQGTDAIAIGEFTGFSNQGGGAIALGQSAGSNAQGVNAIAIGSNAGSNSQGSNAIAIGTLAGSSNQVANSIVLNASNVALQAANAGFYVNPVRRDTTIPGGIVHYNSTTREVVYNESITAINISSGTISTNTITGALGNYSTLQVVNNDATGVSTILRIQAGLNGSNTANNCAQIALESRGGGGATVGYTIAQRYNGTEYALEFRDLGFNTETMRMYNNYMIVNNNLELYAATSTTQAGLFFKFSTINTHAIYRPGNTSDLRIYNYTTLSDQVILKPNGNVGIYTTNPASVLHINGGTANYPVANLSASDAAAKVIMSNAGDLASLWPVSYGASARLYWRNGSTYYFNQPVGTSFFTGQHGNNPVDMDIKENIDNYIGLIVSSADEGYYSIRDVSGVAVVVTGSNAITITEALPRIKLTTNDKDKAVWGVVTNHENDKYYPDGTPIYDVPNPEWGNQLKTTLVRVNGVGEGAIWVTNINGNLENGDYICSSVIPGYGRKQDDDLLHNYTVAKITMTCNFDLENGGQYKCEEFVHEGITYRRAFVGCSYHCS